MSKAELRMHVRAVRRARPEAAIRVASEALATRALSLLPPPPATITAYLSMPTEPGTDALIRDLHHGGYRVLVPRIEGADLAWVDYVPGDPLDTGPLGIREPSASRAAANVPADMGGTAIMFVPGLAVGSDGRRLGQGGGYYDRLLAHVPSRADGGPLIVQLSYDDELLAEVPYELHDRRVDAAVTPSGIVRFDAISGVSPTAST